MAVIDSYSETNRDANIALNGTAGQVNGIAQSFTGDGSTIVSTQFYMSKTGAPTGTATSKIYAHTGTFGTSSAPTGTALATSATLTVSTLTTSLALITFTFTGLATTAATKYVATVEYNSGSTVDTVNVGYDSTSPTHGGNKATKDVTAGTWTAQSTHDVCFYVNNATGAVSSHNLTLLGVGQ